MAGVIIGTIRRIGHSVRNNRPVNRAIPVVVHDGKRRITRGEVQNVPYVADGVAGPLGLPVDVDDEVAVALEDQLAVVGAVGAVVSVCCAGEGRKPCAVARIPVHDEVAVVLEPRAEIAGPVRLGRADEGITRGIDVQAIELKCRGGGILACSWCC